MRKARTLGTGRLGSNPSSTPSLLNGPSFAYILEDGGGRQLRGQVIALALLLPGGQVTLAIPASVASSLKPASRSHGTE